MRMKNERKGRGKAWWEREFDVSQNPAVEWGPMVFLSSVNGRECNKPSYPTDWPPRRENSRHQQSVCSSVHPVRSASKSSHNSRIRKIFHLGPGFGFPSAPREHTSLPKGWEPNKAVLCWPNIEWACCVQRNKIWDSLFVASWFLPSSWTYW